MSAPEETDRLEKAARAKALVRDDMCQVRRMHAELHTAQETSEKERGTSSPRTGSNAIVERRFAKSLRVLILSGSI